MRGRCRWNPSFLSRPRLATASLWVGVPNEEAIRSAYWRKRRPPSDLPDPDRDRCGILWCFGLHDRPGTERPIFGMIRYMNLAGMQRKTKVAAYIEARFSPLKSITAVPGSFQPWL